MSTGTIEEGEGKKIVLASPLDDRVRRIVDVLELYLYIHGGIWILNAPV